MKKGIMELADAIVVHKADGENVRLAKKTVAEYKQILHFLQPATPGWMSTAMPVSSLEKRGLDKVWGNNWGIQANRRSKSLLATRRQQQTKEWFQSMITDHLIDLFYGNPQRKVQVQQLERQILSGQLTVTQGVDRLFSEEQEDK